jgi:hypothetical protein
MSWPRRRSSRGRHHLGADPAGRHPCRPSATGRRRRPCGRPAPARAGSRNRRRGCSGRPRGHRLALSPHDPYRACHPPGHASSVRGSSGRHRTRRRLSDSPGVRHPGHSRPDPGHLRPLAALRPAERRVLIAHERGHLTHRHARKTTGASQGPYGSAHEASMKATCVTPAVGWAAAELMVLAVPVTGLWNRQAGCRRCTASAAMLLCRTAATGSSALSCMPGPLAADPSPALPSAAHRPPTERRGHHSPAPRAPAAGSRRPRRVPRRSPTSPRSRLGRPGHSPTTSASPRPPWTEPTSGGRAGRALAGAARVTGARAAGHERCRLSRSAPPGSWWS